MVTHHTKQLRDDRPVRRTLVVDAHERRLRRGAPLRALITTRPRAPIHKDGAVDGGADHEGQDGAEAHIRPEQREGDVRAQSELRLRGREDRARARDPDRHLPPEISEMLEGRAPGLRLGLHTLMHTLLHTVIGDEGE